MREFTNAEKQQLQAKIEDEQERQNQVVKEFSRRNDGTPKKVSPAWNYGFLGVILCLLAFNVFHLLNWRQFGFDRYGNLVVALMLLFNHIAFSITTKGWPSRIMKTVSVIWMVL